MTGLFIPDAGERPVLLTVPVTGDTSSAGTVLGGWIMTQIDHAAGRAGRLFAGPCVIRAIHEMNFHALLRAGEDLAIFARIGKTGRTSFRLELVGIAMLGTADQATIVDAEATMICIDANGRPQPIKI
ncbi:acyl-CoA thioesterase [Falsirhodobacter sp. 1013]|uniref:acyl-CoA thioesterase n=1 Tax=Falsirhodobacter sp. 1013 TaxID=3417566 RepID=UPI003EBDFDBC